MRDEYDLEALRPAGPRGKYAELAKRGGITVRVIEEGSTRLDPDVREAFPTDEAVNDALRSLMRSAEIDDTAV